MSKRLIASILVSAFGLVGTGWPAHAGSIGRYECNIVGPIGMDAIGDRNGHFLRSLDYTCVGADGVFKGAVQSALSISEVDGSQVTFHMIGGVHRMAEGLAVGESLEGAGSTVVQEGSPTRATASGKMIFKFASGKLAALSGKTFKWAVTPTGFNRFDLEYMD